MTVLGGLQCGKDCVVLHDFLGFNTDDGIRRAAMDSRWDAMKAAKKVSIPMTVLGGLQFAVTVRGAKVIEMVSIPMTVLGGLQSHAVVMRPIRLGKFQYR